MFEREFSVDCRVVYEHIIINEHFELSVVISKVYQMTINLRIM